MRVADIDVMLPATFATYCQARHDRWATALGRLPVRRIGSGHNYDWTREQIAEVAVREALRNILGNGLGRGITMRFEIRPGGARFEIDGADDADRCEGVVTLPRAVTYELDGVTNIRRLTPAVRH